MTSLIWSSKWACNKRIFHRMRKRNWRGSGSSPAPPENEEGRRRNGKSRSEVDRESSGIERSQSGAAASAHSCDQQSHAPLGTEVGPVFGIFAEPRLFPVSARVITIAAHPLTYFRSLDRAETAMPASHGRNAMGLSCVSKSGLRATLDLGGNEPVENAGRRGCNLRGSCGFRVKVKASWSHPQIIRADRLSQW